jgi:hypothetical protein
LVGLCIYDGYGGFLRYPAYSKRLSFPLLDLEYNLIFNTTTLSYLNANNSPHPPFHLI